MVFLALDFEIDVYIACGGRAFGVNRDDFKLQRLASSAKVFWAFETEQEIRTGHFELRSRTDGLLVDVGDLSIHPHPLRQCGTVRGWLRHFECRRAIFGQEEIAIHEPLALRIIISTTSVIAIGIAVLSIVCPRICFTEMIMAVGLRRFVVALGVCTPLHLGHRERLTHVVVRA